MTTIFSPNGIITTASTSGGLAANGPPGGIAPLNFQNIVESLAADYQQDQPVSLLTNTLSTGAVVGTAGGGAGTLSGTLPTGVTIGFGQGNLVFYVAALGISAGGMPYWDLNISGTSSTTEMGINFAASPTGGVPVVAASSYTFNLQMQASVALSNITTVQLDQTFNNSGGTYVNDNASTALPTSTMANFANTQTAGATAVWNVPSVLISFSTSTVIGGRIRFCYPQVLLGSTATTYTAVAADRGTTMKINSAVGFTVTIPHGVFTAGQVVAYRQWGGGTVTVAGDGTSVLVSSSGTYTTRAQGSWIVVKADWDVPNLFWVDGDLT